MKSRASALYYTSFQLYKGCVSQNKLPRVILMMIITKLYIRGYSPFFQKESYNWWVTRRVWGFRQQISKAKYLKMSVAHIGKL